MPKRYHCEYCGKSFQDTPMARRRHLQGAGHQRNRRLHYESFATDRSVRGGQADVLYSELSGEELLQQWLTTHPEVLARYKEQKMKERERRREREGDDGVNDASSGLRGPSGEDLPLYLEPYRSFLPPSLMTPTARTAFPHSLATNDESEWG